MKSFKIADVVDRVYLLFREKMAERLLLDFKITADKLAEVSLHGEPNLAEQLLTEFVKNAIKSTKYGGIEISVKHIGTDNRKYVRYRICVSDTGIGLTSKQIEQLFSQENSEFESCRNLAGELDAKIWVESELGVGSDFYFEASFQLESEIPESVAGKFCGEAEAGVKNRYKILIVEDNEINRFMAQEIVQSAGYGVDTAKDGAQAVEKFRQGDYFAILMDIQMPVMNGFEATAKIRSLQDGDCKIPKIPIIAMTAEESHGIAEQIAAAGMDGCISKPIDMEILIETLEKLAPVRSQ